MSEQQINKFPHFFPAEITLMLRSPQHLGVVLIGLVDERARQARVRILYQDSKMPSDVVFAADHVLLSQGLWDEEQDGDECSKERAEQ